MALRKVLPILITLNFLLVGFAQTFEDDRISQVVSLSSDFNDKGLFHGGLLIAKNNEIIFNKAFGNSLSDVPNSLDTKFNVASMGKMFTGVSVLQLISQNKLSLETKIFEVLPEYSNTKAAKEITIHHLLTHTNGIPELFQMKLDIDPMDPSKYSHEELISFFGNKKLKHKPGKKWSYTNSGFAVLGRIIEKISGQSYCEYIQENILDPSGMSNTGCGFGAGGATSSITDMFNFSKALLSYELLPKEYAEHAMSKKEEVEKEVWCGYGFFGTNSNGGKEVSHSGGVPGQIQCQLLMMVDSGYTVVIYSNNPKGFDSYQELRKSIRRHLS